MFENRTDEQLSIYIYIVSPKTINTIERLKNRDNSAIRDIARLQEAIDQLQEYRNILYERAQFIESAQYTRVLYIKREYHYYSKTVTYRVGIAKEYKEMDNVIEQEEKFPGKERHKAFARFKELKKQNPGIATIEETEKGKWEK